jgi:F-type H+-transporting ATPase subunit beta
MPASDQIKGRLFNVTGDPIDGLPPVPKVNGRPIHSKPPAFEISLLHPKFFLPVLK